MKNHFNCIYMYINKINGKRYIGQAVNFKQRHYKHKYAITHENDDEYNLPIQCAFRKYGLGNFEVEILKENLNTQCLLNFYECYYIKKYNTLAKNKQGYNLSDGGSNGNPLAGKTEEEIKEFGRKQSELKKGENNPNYGKHLSEEHKQKQSEAMKGKLKSEETKQKMKDSWTEERKQKQSELKKGENNPQAKRVAQYDKQGNLIKIWDYITQVTEELGIANSNICKCCKGEIKSCGGYIWQYVDEETKQKIEAYKNNSRRAKRVAQYDLNGNLIKIWDYIKQASDELGINRNSICKCCRGKRKSAGGFIWRYAE